jgi:lysozyme
LKLIAVMIVTAFLTAASGAVSSGQSVEFQGPWTDPTKALVIDFYEENSINWDLLATDARVVGIIHQATDGYYKDRVYLKRRDEAKRRGYAWGSCHVGIPGDGARQADFYLDVAKPAPDEVMALDLESLDPEETMDMDQARQFIGRIKEKTGRYPMVYGDGSVIREISQRFGKDDVFSRTPLWYSRFKGSIARFPKGTWDSYTLWQFKSEMNCSRDQIESCPYLVPGTRTDVDVNVYNGSIAELRENWPFSKAETAKGKSASGQ